MGIFQQSLCDCLPEGTCIEFSWKLGNLRSLSSEESQGVVNRRFGQDFFLGGRKHASDMEICRANIIHIPIHIGSIYGILYMNR